MEQQADRSKSITRHDYLIPKNTRYKNSKSHIHHQEENQNHQLNDERVLHENRSHTSSDPIEFGDDEDDEDDSNLLLEQMRYSDARMGICSVCHFSMRGNNASPKDFDKALLCSNGHLLCHRCVQKFSMKSDTHCVLCAAVESQQSSSVSRVSSIKSIKTERRSRTSSSRSRRDRRRKDADRYTTSRAASRTNIASHYNIGLNYDDYWNDIEHEGGVIDEETEEELTHVSADSKQQSYCNLVQKEESNSAMTAQINSQMLSECSRRPIQCPRLDCAVNVAFSALTNHFIFDHPEVPILNVDPGETSTFIVNFDGLIYDSSHCLALLLVSGKLSGPAAKQFNGSHIHPRYKNRLPLPILAARLHCTASYDSRVHEAGEGRRDDGGDVVIAWVAGLDIGNTTTGALRCSIQAIDSIDNEAFRSLTYSGPINSLRTAQKPREVFLIGDCVILHDGFINHITSGCENLNINVTIY